MPNDRRAQAVKIILASIALLFASSALVFGQAGWKAVQEMGFSFRYPSDWNYIDLGGDDYDGTKGYVKALSPPSEANFAIVIMIFPQFSYDLKENNMTYKDFIKSVFESFLKEGDMKDLTIEETDSTLKQGKVPAFMVMEEKNEKNLKASMICGDLVRGNAAILIITMNLPVEESETGKQYLSQAEQIMASFAFPK